MLNLFFILALTLVFIPCHRMVRNNGQLGDYRWGIERKQQLLASEHTAHTTPFSSAGRTNHRGEKERQRQP